MTDLPTDQSTDQQTNQPTDGQGRKLKFQCNNACLFYMTAKLYACSSSSCSVREFAFILQNMYTFPLMNIQLDYSVLQ